MPEIRPARFRLASPPAPANSSSEFIRAILHEGWNVCTPSPPKVNGGKNWASSLRMDSPEGGSNRHENITDWCWNSFARITRRTVGVTRLVQVPAAAMKGMARCGAPAGLRRPFARRAISPNGTSSITSTACCIIPAIGRSSRTISSVSCRGYRSRGSPSPWPGVRRARLLPSRGAAGILPAQRLGRSLALPSHGRGGRQRVLGIRRRGQGTRPAAPGLREAGAVGSRV